MSDASAAGGHALPGTVLELLEEWERFEPVLAAIAAKLEADAPNDALEESSIRLAQPVKPRKVYCVGANYSDHLAEMGDPSERQPGRPPFFYMKPASTALCGPGDTVRIPGGCLNFDWEGEVVVVFGAGGFEIPVERALSLVAGYTLGIDFTARDQMVDPELVFGFNFSLGKCQDDTAPIGPWIVPARFINGDDIDFALDRNGTRKQASNTSHMLYSVSEQIAEISRRIRIEPGDILFTGTPAGVGFPRGERVEDGDLFIASSPAIGDLAVRVRRRANEPA